MPPPDAPATPDASAPDASALDTSAPDARPRGLAAALDVRDLVAGDGLARGDLAGDDLARDDLAGDGLDALADALPRRVALDDPAATPDGEAAHNGLAQLVLTLVKLLHDLLEKQAIRRMDAGTLTDDEVERVGRTLMRQADTLRDLCDAFGLTLDDLDLDLGSLDTVG